jgi:adenosine kinase
MILKIIVTGSIAFDTLMQFPGKFSDHFIPEKLNSISVSFLVDTMKKQRGGCGPNIAYSLALLGEQPLLVGTAGQDFPEYREVLNQAGVDTSGVHEIPGVYTASFFGNTDRVGNQICSFYTGAMQFAKEYPLKPFLSLAGSDAMVIISPNDPAAMLRYADECRRSQICFIFDPGQQIIRLSAEDLLEGAKGAFIQIVNEYELEMLKKKTGLDDKGLFSLAENVIVTLGAKGSEIRTKDKTTTIPAAKPKRVSDPTGVGDAFRSGLIKGLALGLSWETAGRMGSLAATYVLEVEGPQSHHYTLQEFVQRYVENFGRSEEIQKLIL